MGLMAAITEAPHLPTLFGRVSARTLSLPSKKEGEFHEARFVANSTEKVAAEAIHPPPRSMFRGNFYVESRPVSGKLYFPTADGDVQAAVVVCMYNEDAADLSRTLESLAVGPPLDIVVVADGLEKLSDSAREYLMQAFDLQAAVLEDTTYDQMDYKNDTLRYQVFISDPVSLGKRGTRACVLLKRFNHRKINSHEWFFKAHAPNTGCPYSLTTDCGAFFRPGAIEKLLTHLSTHEKCVAVTARQRVMSEYNHRIFGHTTPERDTWLEWALRMWQGFDFELDSSGVKATDCAGGLTVCLHGPCAMFRLEDIQGKCLEGYFDEWGYAPAHKLSLYGANLQLGEDRILSFLSATASTKHLSCLWDAVFEFDPELSLKRLVTQRRRWKNSIMCHTYYTLTQMPSVTQSGYPWRFKLANQILLGAKIFEHVVALFLPAMFGIQFVSSVGLLAGLMGPVWQLLAEAFQLMLYATLYALFVHVHLKRSHGDCVLQPVLATVVFIYTTTMTLVNVGALAQGIWSGRLAEGPCQVLLIPLVMPFVTTFVSGSYEGWVIMIRSWLVYYLTGPFAGFWGAYNFARLADVSWGNRPVASASVEERKQKSTGLQHEAEMQQEWLERQMSRCGFFNLVLVVVNLVIIVYVARLLPRTLSIRSQAAPRASYKHEHLPYVFMFFGSGVILQFLLAIVYHASIRVFGNEAHSRPTKNLYSAIPHDEV